MVSLLEFYYLLESHDWYHMMSDDYKVDRKGQAEYEELMEIAQTSNEHEELFEAYELYMFTGNPWDTDRAPKPEKPKE